VGGRYQVFNTLRQENVFSLTRAFDPQEDRPVLLVAFPRAIFRDFPQASAQLRFHAEQLGRFSSPFLLNLLGAGETSALFYFVEESPRGQSLSEILRDRRRRNQPFTDREALGIAWLLCRALEGVQDSAVHGFLHPLEIYLDPWPDGPIPFFPRMAHIGIRAMLRAVLRRPFEGLEEEASCYGCPEFVACRPLGRQADIYGVGAILYSLLTLRGPTGRFIRPSGMRPGLPEAVDRILLRALDEDPEERYAAPSDLAAALEGLWVRGSCRQELGKAADRLVGERPVSKAAAREAGLRARSGRWGTVGETSAEPGAPAPLIADRARVVCLVLLTLLNLGLALGAMLVAGSRGLDEISDSGALARWEALFSRTEPGGPAGAMRSG
jgi:hypothetical protein